MIKKKKKKSPSFLVVGSKMGSCAGSSMAGFSSLPHSIHFYIHSFIHSFLLHVSGGWSPGFHHLGPLHQVQAMRVMRLGNKRRERADHSSAHSPPALLFWKQQSWIQCSADFGNVSSSSGPDIPHCSPLSSLFIKWSSEALICVLSLSCMAPDQQVETKPWRI